MFDPEPTFAARVAALRESRGLTVYALAKLAGVSSGHLYQLEAGDRTPSLDTASKLADALGVSLDALRGAVPAAAPATEKKSRKKP